MAAASEVLSLRAMRAFSKSMGNRVVFLIGHAVPDRARAAAAHFGQRLNASPLFDAVHSQVPVLDSACAS